MSTFSGKIEEVPEISVDRFDGRNFDAEAFFLSHCHTDHMHGLDIPAFHQNLIETNRFIYVSHISAEILKNTHPKIANNLVELEFTYPTVVSLKNRTLMVTPIPAGHCPGSVMFLFETDKIVLYTGDFRINHSDIPKFQAFYDSMQHLKKIDTVYLDTTFFLRDYERFPPRNDSLEEVCRIIEDWTSRSDLHVVSLSTPARYGYEYLFMEIYKKLKTPIHVNSEAFDLYSRVPELDKAVTRNPRTPVHSACGSHYTLICCNTITYKVKTIKVSAFRWKNDNLQNGISAGQHYTHFVCYSTHASYEEAAALLKFLKPRRVKANVLSDSAKVNEEIYKNMQAFVDEELEEGPKMKKVKLFPVGGDAVAVCDAGGEDGLTDIERSILDSPPRTLLS